MSAVVFCFKGENLFWRCAYHWANILNASCYPQSWTWAYLWHPRMLGRPQLSLKHASVSGHQLLLHNFWMFPFKYFPYSCLFCYRFPVLLKPSRSGCIYHLRTWISLGGFSSLSQYNRGICKRSFIFVAASWKEHNRTKSIPYSLFSLMPYCYFQL